MNISLNTSVESNATVDVSGTSNKIIVIPQTIAAGTEIFDVLFTVNGEDKHFCYSLTDALTLNKGTQYTYTLNINLKSASNLNDNLNCSKELEHYAS